MRVRHEEFNVGLRRSVFMITNLGKQNVVRISLFAKLGFVL
jgi:hypothetical protein